MPFTYCAYLLAGAVNRESIAKSSSRQTNLLRFSVNDHRISPRTNGRLHNVPTATWDGPHPFAAAAAAASAPRPLVPLVALPNFIWYSRLFTTLIIWNRAITAAKLYQKNTGRGRIRAVNGGFEGGGGIYFQYSHIASPSRRIMRIRMPRFTCFFSRMRLVTR